jgi:hypothetical protein
MTMSDFVKSFRRTFLKINDLLIVDNQYIYSVDTGKN